MEHSYFKNVFFLISAVFWSVSSYAEGMMSHMSMDNRPSSADSAVLSQIPHGEKLKELVPLKNQSVVPSLFKADLVAAPVAVEFIPGVKTTVWAYNNSLPGPLIEVNEGDKVDISFRNLLAQPTTIHWHGLPIPPEQDGNPMDPVLPNNNHVYQFSLPTDSAGTYWYHPHPHKYTAEQVYRGLAGAFIVKPKNDPLKDIPERNLMISDLKLTASGEIADSNMHDWMNGREGQFVLINGQLQPTIELNGTQHWRIWNATSARYLALTLSGHKFTLVGTDGGLLQKPVRDMQKILLAPAERIEIVVDPLGENRKIALLAEPYNRGKMGNAAPETTITLASVALNASGSTYTVPEHLRKIDELGQAKAVKKLVFTETMSMAHGQHSMAFLINGKVFDMERIDFVSRLHDVELWEITNKSDMDHPFHIHGTQFQVVDTQWNNTTAPAPYLAWKDTVNVRSGETVRIKVRQDFSGLRMLHCHILEHEVQGMMATQLVK